ncbi:uncharacterized protein LOC130736535 [Lotus japonicus]|uniref:uncharacterized protein LOC130736535 n=1 Tax=Lotus japonicus TaxID=34305 RepID=UPI00258ED335|nr:uncharacterized protein LOC130736535 [Lotus japonicus]
MQRANEALQTQVTELTHGKTDHQGSDRHTTTTVVNFQPFSQEIAEEEIPEHVKTLALDSYSGSSDPKEHLVYFNTRMVIAGVNDAVKCKLLPSTFRKSAMTWFTTLPPGSNADFTEFSTRFLSHFSTSRSVQATITAFLTVIQRENESIKSYMTRFNELSVYLEDSVPSVCVAAFKNGLREGRLNGNLKRHQETSMVEIRARARSYILEEEDNRQKQKRDGTTSLKGATHLGPASKFNQAKTNRPGPYQARLSTRPSAPKPLKVVNAAEASKETGTAGMNATCGGTMLNAPVSDILKEATCL